MSIRNSFAFPAILIIGAIALLGAADVQANLALTKAQREIVQLRASVAESVSFLNETQVRDNIQIIGLKQQIADMQATDDIRSANVKQMLAMYHDLADRYQSAVDMERTIAAAKDARGGKP